MLCTIGFSADVLLIFGLLFYVNPHLFFSIKKGCRGSRVPSFHVLLFLASSLAHGTSAKAFVVLSLFSTHSGFSTVVSSVFPPWVFFSVPQCHQGHHTDFSTCLDVLKLVFPQTSYGEEPVLSLEWFHF